MTIAFRKSDPVNSVGVLVVARAGGLRENFVTTKNLTLSDRLQEARYNSKEGFKNVWVDYSAIGLPQREFWRWVSAHNCMASRLIVP